MTGEGIAHTVFLLNHELAEFSKILKIISESTGNFYGLIRLAGNFGASKNVVFPTKA